MSSRDIVFPELLLDALVHVALLSTILQVAFEFKLAKLESSAIHSEVKHALETCLGDVFKHLDVSPRMLKAVGAFVQDDKQHSAINELVLSRNWYFVGGMWLAAIGLYFTMSSGCDQKSKAQHALVNVAKNNLGMLAIVGAIEAVFISKVVLEYVPSKPSVIRNTVLKRLRNLDETATCKSSSDDTKLPSAVVGPPLAAAIVVLVSVVLKFSESEFSMSSIMWQGTVVAAVVSLFFLTMGTMQETLVMESTVKRIVDSYTVPVYKSIRELSPASAASMRDRIDAMPTEDSGMDAADRAVEEKNKTLRERAYMIIGITLGAAIVVTGIEFSLSGRREGREKAMRSILVSSALSACCSFIAELNFMANVAASTRPLSVSDVNKTILDIAKEDSQLR